MDVIISVLTVPFHLPGGRSRSATILQIKTAIREVAAKGIKEVILTGVNTGDFGRGGDEKFLDLIKELDQTDEIKRYRISSVEPNLLTDEIIEFVARSRHFMPHFHIPLQSGSNEVLKLMHRRYSRELFAEKIKRIKSLLPDAFIGVDIIVGHAGEKPKPFSRIPGILSQLFPSPACTCSPIQNVREPKPSTSRSLSHRKINISG